MNEPEISQSERHQLGTVSKPEYHHGIKPLLPVQDNSDRSQEPSQLPRLFASEAGSKFFPSSSSAARPVRRPASARSSLLTLRHLVLLGFPDLCLYARSHLCPYVFVSPNETPIIINTMDTAVPVAVIESR
jgi:hypothetical protein